MRRNFRYALRSLIKDRLFTAIGVLSICIGVFASVIVAQFIIHEWRYDTFHLNRDKIYRILSWNDQSGTETSYPAFSSRLAPELKLSSPGISNFVRIYRNGVAIVKRPDRPGLIGEEPGFIFADTSFFSVFTFPIISGDHKFLLNKLNTVVISERMAAKYYGGENPVGKILSINKDHLFEVVAVAKNPPSNSTLTFDFITSVQTFEKMDPFAFSNLPNFETFVQIEDGETLEQLARNIKSVNKLIKPINYNEEDKYRLEPLEYLRMSSSYTYNDKSSIRFIPVFLFTAIGILILSIVNYINLITSRSSLKQRETELRVILGAGRFLIFNHYFTQTFIVNFLGFALGLVGAIIFRTKFNELIGTTIDSMFLLDREFVIGLIIIFTFSLLLTSACPLFLTITTFKKALSPGLVTTRKHSSWGRQTLTLFQFTISVCLILASILISDQVKFLSKLNTGFEKDRVISIAMGPNLSKRSQYIKSEVERINGVESISLTNSGLFKSHEAAKFRTGAGVIGINLHMLKVDKDFPRNFSLRWILPPDRNAPTTQDDKWVVLNKSALTAFKLTPDIAVGSDILWEGGAAFGKIAGIVEDFNTLGPTQQVSPMMLLIQRGQAQTSDYNYLQVRFNELKDFQTQLGVIQRIFKNVDPEYPFKFTLMKDDFDKVFLSEVRFAKIISLFTFIANLLACLGLLGLIAYIVSSKSKEIGIRKIVGASFWDISKMLYLQFFVIVLIAIIIASPIAYWIIVKWITNFPYKSPIVATSFASGALVSLLLAFITISIQGIKSAVSSPIDAIRQL